ncbi:MAG TPA: YdeI/OmpD-associated family protein [Mucilaginibacter sp.]|jgi:hypothetical protein|nr:YdeI/OmpD-associated family protein [Mucilaginibacter sp.]
MSPIAKKLQIKPGKNWLFYDAPDNYLAALEPLPDGATATFNPGGNIDGVQIFVIDSTQLAKSLQLVAPLLRPDTVIWATYPKKASGIKTDLEMTKSWDEATKYGLRPVAAAGIDDNWTAIRLRPEEQTKVSEFCNEEIEKNDHSQYIDLVNRKVIPPADMQAVLTKSTAAMAFFDSLSFTNKKEYVVWILSAKQEKTKNDRLEKLTEKLLSKKKNPSEK